MDELVKSNLQDEIKTNLNTVKIHCITMINANDRNNREVKCKSIR